MTDMESEDLEFMSELEAAAHLKPSRAAQAFLAAVVLLVVWMFAWMANSSIDEQVRGTGQVMPSGDVQVVQSLDGGIVSAIMVHEGDTVKKGQVLMRIADVQYASEGQSIAAQKAALEAREARLQAESAGAKFEIPPDVAKNFPDIAANEEKLYQSRQDELSTALNIIQDQVQEATANLAEVRSSIAQLTKSKALLQKQVDIDKRLAAAKAIPEIELIKDERELNDTSGNLSSAYDSEQSLQAKLRAANRKESEKKGAFRSDALGQMNDTEAKLSALTANLQSVNDKVNHAELRAPVDGVVQQVNVKTVGGVIQPAQKLVEIVPLNESLVIRARIAPKDVAFLRPGQKVKVRITAYDPEIYGTLDGKLIRISPNTIEDSRGRAFFQIDVRTDKNYLGTKNAPYRIFSGMVAETDVIVGRRTLLTYLLKPVLRTKDRAFTEQ
ncbi:MAG: HlyD family type I secretion periplasmic adaptor subunit [Alphaproteobacteria bacterium]|nr:HlyD family type I secretion periplasmic adaptor subunit [Alphaproteobacteria bacterium]